MWGYYGQSKGGHSLWCELAPRLIMKIDTSGNFSVYYILTELWFMELKQPRRRRRQERHKYPYLTIKNFSYACLAHFSYLNISFALLVLSMAWNQLFCICMDDVSTIDKFWIFILLSPKRGLQLISGYAFCKHDDIEKWLQKCEVTFSDEVVAVADVIFAYYLKLLIQNYSVGVRKDLDQQLESNWVLKNKAGYMES